MADKQYVKKIADYYVKDEEARETLSSINTTVEQIKTTTNQQTTTINGHTITLSQMTTTVNNLSSRVETLESGNLSMSYDATTETITFS